MRMAWVKFCSAISTVRSKPTFSSLILSMVRLTSSGARPTDGSSISRMRGADISARASASICCSPPLMLPASCLARSLRRGKVSKQKSRLRWRAARALGRKAPSCRFSITLCLGNSRRPSGTKAMPRSTISSVERPTSSCVLPSMVAVMVPAVGRTIPMMHFIRVDLPLPLVPSSATVSPAPTLSDTPSSTRTAPYPASTFATVRLLAVVELLAKVRPHDFGVAHDFLRVAVGDLAAGDQHDQPLRHFHHGAHDVLDHDDGDTLPVDANEQRDDLVDFS